MDTASTGTCAKGIHLLFSELGASLPSDTHEIEGINGSIRRITNTAPNIKLGLLSARVSCKNAS